MHRRRNVKILATVGPSSASTDRLRALFEAGVDTFRLNFSHGTREDHASAHAAIRALEDEMRRPIGILQDLQGPKFRVGNLQGGSLDLKRDEIVGFTLSGDGSRTAIPLPHPEIFEAIHPGNKILIDDGRIIFTVCSVSAGHFEAKVDTPGRLLDRKGVNLPGTVLNLSPLTRKDRADLEFGFKLGMDWVALSFVQRPDDLIEARDLIDGRSALMAKIEKPVALQNISEIIRLSDAIMVARGDLGVEIPHEDVPGRQKELIVACRQAGKPVVVATQMLDSMVNAPTPTRAEASDVATAVYDGADAVMLSAESASGAFPIEAVDMMDRIIRRTEAHRNCLPPSALSHVDHTETTADAVAAAAAGLAIDLRAATIVAFTSRGATAARIARKRSSVPLLALTPTLEIARRLCLLWGAHCVVLRDVENYEEMVDQASIKVCEEGLAGPGDLFIIVAGVPFGQAGSTNNLRVARAQGSTSRIEGAADRALAKCISTRL